MLSPIKTNEWDLESKLKHYIDHLDDDRSMYIRNHASSFNKPGISDWLFLVKGSLVAVELKNPNSHNNSHLRKVQFDFLKDISIAGGISIVAYDLEIIDRVITSLLSDNDDGYIKECKLQSPSFKNYDDYLEYLKFNKGVSIILK